MMHPKLTSQFHYCSKSPLDLMSGNFQGSQIPGFEFRRHHLQKKPKCVRFLNDFIPFQTKQQPLLVSEPLILVITFQHVSRLRPTHLHIKNFNNSFGRFTVHILFSNQASKIYCEPSSPAPPLGIPRMAIFPLPPNPKFQQYEISISNSAIFIVNSRGWYPVCLHIFTACTYITRILSFFQFSLLDPLHFFPHLASFYHPLSPFRSSCQPSISMSLDQSAFDTLFYKAHTEHGFTTKPIDEAALQKALEMALLGPTAYNCSPLRFVPFLIMFLNISL